MNYRNTIYNFKNVAQYLNNKNVDEFQVSYGILNYQNITF